VEDQALPAARGHEHEICVVVTEAGSYLRLIDSCITQLEAQGPSRTCNESKEEEKEVRVEDQALPAARGHQHQRVVPAQRRVDDLRARCGTTAQRREVR